MTPQTRKKELGFQQSKFKRMINLSEFDSQNILTLPGSFNDDCNLADGFINKAPELLSHVECCDRGCKGFREEGRHSLEHVLHPVCIRAEDLMCAVVV